MEAVLQRRSAHSHVACNIEKLVGMREGEARTYPAYVPALRRLLFRSAAPAAPALRRHSFRGACAGVTCPRNTKPRTKTSTAPARASESMRSAPEGGQERGRNGVKSKRSRAYTINTIYCGCRPNRTVVHDPPRGHAYQNSRGFLRASAALMVLAHSAARLKWVLALIARPG